MWAKAKMSQNWHIICLCTSKSGDCLQYNPLVLKRTKMSTLKGKSIVEQNLHPIICHYCQFSALNWFQHASELWGWQQTVTETCLDAWRLGSVLGSCPSKMSTVKEMLTWVKVFLVLLILIITKQEVWCPATFLILPCIVWRLSETFYLDSF